jgi:hypothetical protein
MDSARTEKQRSHEVATEKTEGPIARFHEVTLKNDDIAYALINREYGLAISPEVDSRARAVAASACTPQLRAFGRCENADGRRPMADEPFGTRTMKRAL